jgi:hypothetical protein
MGRDVSATVAVAIAKEHNLNDCKSRKGAFSGLKFLQSHLRSFISARRHGEGCWRGTCGCWRSTVG